MIRLQRIIGFGILLLPPALGNAQAQSASPIGDYLAPWSPRHGLVAMTHDGEWIAFVEEKGGPGCAPLSFEQRISLIRPDGTGYREVVSGSTLFSLPSSGFTLINDLRISGDGKTILFSWPDLVAFCDEFPPLHTFLVDVEDGTVSELLYKGLPAGSLGSFTDDGRHLAFKAFDPESNKYGFYVANADGSDPELFLDASPWYNAWGIISGDGRRFTFAARHQQGSSATDLLSRDMRTGQLVTLTPQPTPSMIFALSQSYDGSRVVYGEVSEAEIYAVNGDGSDHRVLTDDSFSSTATITRNGEFVFYMANSDEITPSFPFGIPKGRRIRWSDGGGGQYIEAATVYGTGVVFAHQPVNATGNRYAGGSPHTVSPLVSWTTDTPRLTTYGYVQPGTDLHWDVGGRVGSHYALAFALTPAALPLPGIGILGLEPTTLQILALGTITDPKLEIGSTVITIPDPLAVPLPLDVYFQAFVVSPGGSLRLSNTTHAAIVAPPAPSDSTSPPARGRTQVVPAHLADFPRAPRPTWQPGAPPPSPEDVQAWIDVFDPPAWVMQRLAQRSAPSEPPP